MRNQLTSYVELLFAGNPEAADIKQEILQNTLDRYDDLVAQGKNPEAAYSMAISGIGDVSELLRGTAAPAETQVPVQQTVEEKKKSKLLRAIAVGLYIACPVPLFLIHNELGLCLLLVMVAAATVLMIFAGRDGRKAEPVQQTPEMKLRKSIESAVSTVGLVIYFIVSFLTMAWPLTWIIFLITAAVNGLINAIMDLKEAK